MDRATLKDELKRLVVESLRLEDTKPEDIADQEPLFGGGLGLDSIDALELAVALERRFKVSIPDQEVGKRAFQTIETMADYVLGERKQEP